MLQLTHVIELDYTYDGEIVDFLKSLQTNLDEYNIAIVAIDPEGPGGGWPCISFAGKEEDLKNFITKGYLADDDKQHAEYLHTLIIKV